jgi:hypothetical protein
MNERLETLKKARDRSRTGTRMRRCWLLPLIVIRRSEPGTNSLSFKC